MLPFFSVIDYLVHLLEEFCGLILLTTGSHTGQGSACSQNSSSHLDYRRVCCSHCFIMIYGQLELICLSNEFSNKKKINK